MTLALVRRKELRVAHFWKITLTSYGLTASLRNKKLSIALISSSEREVRCKVEK
jgi:hypothetical protein